MDEKPVERFKPTTGGFVGYLGLGVAAFTVVYCAVSVHTVIGLRVALAAVFAALVIWVTQLRPRATAYQRDLVLSGSIRDVRLPYVAIEDVSVTQMLNVFAEGRRYVCVGIGKGIVSDMKARAKKEKERSKLGSGRLREFSEKAEMAAPDQTAMSYQTFVVTRIEELVDQAKRDLRRSGGSTEGEQVRRPYAVPEIVALAVTCLAFAVSLFV